MADPSIKISITADDKASAKLGALDSQVDKTGGGMGKLGAAAAGGAAAVVALGVKSVMAFQDTGLAVGKMTDATGLTSEAASRLKEVAEDMGISQETVSSSIGKMSKALGANKDAFAEYNIEAVKGADGQTDVNETFLNAVDRINQIQDPLKKAEAASKVFGKGYQQMGELLNKSSGDIRQSLAAVSDQKVFDDKKIGQARDLRDAFDEIMDAGQDLMLTIGQALAPVIAKLAPILGKVIEAAGPLAESIGGLLVTALEAIGPIIEALLPLVQGLAKALSLVAGAVSELTESGLEPELQKAADGFQALKDKALAAGLSTDEFNALVKDAGTSIKLTGDDTKDFNLLVDELGRKLDTVTGQTERSADATEHLGLVNRDNAGPAVRKTADELEHAGVAAQDLHDKSYALATAEAQLAEDANRAALETRNLRAEWELLFGVLDADQAVLDLETQFNSLAEAQKAAMDAAASNAEDAREKQIAYQNQLIETKRRVGEYAKEIGGLPPSVVSEIFAQVDQGSITTAEQALDAVAKARQVIYNAQVSGHREFETNQSSNGFSNTRGAPAGTEMAIGRPTTGQTIINVAVHTGADPQQVIEIVKRYQSTGGRL